MTAPDLRPDPHSSACRRCENQGEFCCAYCSSLRSELTPRRFWCAQTGQQIYPRPPEAD